MARARTMLNQVNIVSGDLDASMAFYRRLAMEIPDDTVWRTDSGAHHVNARAGDGGAKRLEIDSVAFAPHWARYAVVEDPDGIAVGLKSPVSAGKRSAPPKP